ncbi:MAG: DNA-directed RNA polymerase [Candidatus Thermoplasmatota archaeon]|nr:DNA-directed RNA polymerase [Candidatus Thermoplasmatota archaeon]
MYYKVRREEVVRIPPDRLGEDIDELARELTRSTYEGKVASDKSFTLLATNVERLDEGRIVHGDGAVYQKVAFDAVVLRPLLQEVVDGEICEVMKFGAFIRFGPLDGLLHISQVMDDRVDVDVDNQRLVGKDTKRDLRRGDRVRARIVAASINERSPRESKIGLTMRQPGLGKFEWIEEDRRKGPVKVQKKKKRGRRR